MNQQEYDSELDYDDEYDNEEGEEEDYPNWKEEGGGEENYFSRVLKLEKDKSRLLTLAAVLFVVILVSGSYYQVVLKNEDEATIVIIDFDYERAYADAEYLVDAGPRLAGTPEELRGSEYVVEQWKEAGLSNTHVENFTVELYEVNSASLGLDAFTTEKGYSRRNYQHRFEFTVLGYSGSTSGSDNYDVAYVGNGTDEAYAQAGDVSGMAVLVETDSTLSYTQLYKQAMNHSAAANVIYGDRFYPISRTSVVWDEDGEGLVPITSEYDHNQLIPHLMVSRTVGNDVKSWWENATGVGEYCSLDMNIDVTIEDRTTTVAVGEVLGSEKPEELIIMGAHLDTVYCGEGGADNTAGVAGIMETARQIAQYQPKRTIRFLTFGAEEAGLFGSKEYVLAHAQEIEDHCVFMTNFDMTDLNITEDGKHNSLPINTNSEKRRREIEKVGNKFFDQNPNLAEKYTFRVGTMENYPYSDFYHFALHGADFAACWGTNCPGYHTPNDRLSNTNPESWQVAGGIMGSHALYLANK